VAKEAKEEEENRRGCREEREFDGGSWWSVGGWNGGEREGEKKTAETG
jgi:hypothetical protein